MERFVSENPDPVLRIGRDERVIYSNKAGELFLQEWNIRVGEKVPISIGNFSKRVISRKDPEKTQIKVEKRVYLVSFYPVKGGEQVDVYGFDITDYKKLKEKLRIKEKQHDALNQMGRMALRCENLQTFMDKSVKLVAKALGVEYSRILELCPDGDFLLRAGTGWKAGFVGKTIVKGSKGSQAGYTLFSKIPVTVRDFKKEERFSASAVMKNHGVASGISVVIGKMENPFGVLSAHSKKPRRFTADDTYFLNSVAFLISEVIERRRVEEELRQYKEKLEELVKERTFELVKTNQRLTEEIAGRKQVEKALQNNVYFLKTLLDAIPSPVYYRNLEGIYQGCNEMFASILGLPEEKIVGHSIFEFRKQFSDEAIEISTFYDRILLEEGKSIPHELKVRFAIDGEEKDFLVHRATYSNISGEVIGIVGVMLDITERKKAEQALLKTEEVRKKEIHHRIKNNLQVISSLLSLQAEHFSDKKVKESFQDSQNRVISMSLIHEELYKTGEIGDFETFDFKEYLQKLANELFRSYLVGNQDTHLKLDIESTYLGMDTGIPLGIIINELVSNSLKHAFPAGREGEIQIKLHKIESEKISGEDRGICRHEISEFLLAVSDNGVGIPEKIDFRHPSSLGLQLVNILVDQIEGSIELVRGAGTEFRIKFREDACS